MINVSFRCFISVNRNADRGTIIAWAQLKESHVLSVFAEFRDVTNFAVCWCWTESGLNHRPGLANHHLPHKGKNCTTTYKSIENTIMLAGSNLKLDIRILDVAVSLGFPSQKPEPTATSKRSLFASQLPGGLDFVQFIP